jgi:virginiamycin B lyase
LGNIDEFELPTPNSEPRGITIGPDGAVWVALEIGALARLVPPEPIDR